VDVWSLVARRRGVPVDLRRWIAKTYMWDGDVYPTKLVKLSWADELFVKDSSKGEKSTLLLYVYMFLFLFFSSWFVPDGASNQYLLSYIAIAFVLLRISYCYLSNLYRDYRGITNNAEALFNSIHVDRSRVYRSEPEQWERCPLLETEGFRCIFHAVLPSIFTVPFLAWPEMKTQRFSLKRPDLIQSWHDLSFCAICVAPLELSICVAGVRFLLYRLSTCVYRTQIISVGLCMKCGGGGKERTPLGDMRNFHGFSNRLDDASLTVENELRNNSVQGRHFLSRFLNIYHRDLWEANMCKCLSREDCTCSRRTFSLFPESDIIVLKE